MNSFPTFLLIDDDLEDQEIFVLALNIAFPEAQCSCCTSCPEAIEKINNKIISIPEFIFMDMDIPKSGGIDCIRLLNEAAPLGKTKLIIISGSTPHFALSELLQVGVKKVIKKRGSIGILAEEIIGAVKAA
jgi:CheY-like chemotaxis protein